MNTAGGFSAVLFDLDGTLADSAPDLVAALSTLSREIGEPEPDPNQPTAEDIARLCASQEPGVNWNALAVGMISRPS